MKAKWLKIKNKVLIATLLITSAIAFYRCNKDELNRNRMVSSNAVLSNPVDNASVNVAENAEVATASFNEVTTDVQEIVNVPISNLKSAGFSDHCRTITFTPSDSVYPRTITINYGTSGCMNWRSKYKKGKIIINITSAPTDSLSMITITLDSLVINGNKVEGSKTMQYLGKLNGNPTWKSEITGGKVTTPGGSIITYDVKDKILTMIAGQKTPGNYWDDVYSLSGTSMGTYTRDTFSRAYYDTITVSNPMILADQCRYPQGGDESVTVSNDGKIVRTVNINYGNYVKGSTACKSDVTITVNGKVVYSYAKD
jgi:hypothetical protein